MKTIFIDGEAGTTGLGIATRLADLPVRLLSLPPDQRKNPEARQAIMAEADLVILCLPDEAARQAVALAQSLGPKTPRLLDASSAHRTAAGWVYGLAELSPEQPARIASAACVSNPGCYATGAIALLHPLVAAGLIPPEAPLSLNAVSGYSGGGKQMIAAHEAEGGPAFELYGLDFAHKHIPEIMQHGGLTTRPIFIPSVAHMRQGMLVSLPLHLPSLPGHPTPAQLHQVLRSHYAHTPHIRVVANPPPRPVPDALNNTDALEIYTYISADESQLLLVACLDNLGKGASGAAIQNLKLMLGIDTNAL